MSLRSFQSPINSARSRLEQVLSSLCVLARRGGDMEDGPEAALSGQSLMPCRSLRRMEDTIRFAFLQCGHSYSDLGTCCLGLVVGGRVRRCAVHLEPRVTVRRGPPAFRSCLVFTLCLFLHLRHHSRPLRLHYLGCSSRKRVGLALQ